MRASNEAFLLSTKALQDAGADTSADGAATLTKREARASFQGNGVNQLADHLDVVTRVNQLLVRVLDAFRELEGAGDVGRADEELWTVVVHERSVCGSERHRKPRSVWEKPK